MEPKIIFEDDYLLILDKPAGWIVNEAATTKGQKVIQTWLKSKDYSIAKSREYRSGVVHRLDKETSGMLVVAKTKDNTLGKIGAIADLARKKSPRVVRPENPTLPDLYQVNFL